MTQEFTLRYVPKRSENKNWYLNAHSSTVCSNAHFEWRDPLNRLCVSNMAVYSPGYGWAEAEKGVREGRWDLVL